VPVVSETFADVTRLANQHLDAATAEAWLRLVRPTVALVETAPDDNVVARLGRQPLLPAGTPWPQWAAVIPPPSGGRLAFFVPDDSDGHGFADSSDLYSYHARCPSDQDDRSATIATPLASESARAGRRSARRHGR
jgi:hypothetical protein